MLITQATKLPKVIFIVGNASAGKTTLAKTIKGKLPFYNIISDLDEFKKMLELEKISGERNRIKPLASGGFNIIDPTIWDDVLISTVQKIMPGKFYIFEFARGIDPVYLTALGLKKYQVYDHCFEVILAAKPGINVSDVLIIHVYCNFVSRLNRNQKRKLTKQHFVAEHVMHKVYSEENFRYVPTGQNMGYLNKKNKILVFYINNSKDLSLEATKEYFGLQIRKILNFYTSNVLLQNKNKRRIQK